MARIRTIKPEFYTHEQLSELPASTHLLAGALLNYADDDGYFNANPKLIRAACCPLREPSVSIHDSLKSLSEIGYLQLGVADDGRTYGRIVKFKTHQRVDKPSPSKIKTLGINWGNSKNVPGMFQDDSQGEQGTGKGTGNGEQGKEVSAADAADRDECEDELRDWLNWWNTLKSESLVPHGVNVDEPNQGVVRAWKRVRRDAKLRKMLADRDAIEREIRASEFCRESWFRLEKLFGGSNRDGELILRKLLDKAYQGKTNGKSGPRFASQRFPE